MMLPRRASFCNCGNIVKTFADNGDEYINGEYRHDNGDGTYTFTAKDGTVRITDEQGSEITPPEDKKPSEIEDPGNSNEYPVNNFPVNDGSDFFPVYDEPAGKRGGLAVMMKDGGVPHFADAGPVWAQGNPNIKDNGNGTYTQTHEDGSTILLDKDGAPLSSTDKTPDPTIDPVQSILDLLKTTGGAAGAGGILAALLGSTGGSTNTQNTGIDMSTYGLLKPRTTNFGMGPAKYVSQRDYSPQSTYKRNDELLHNLNAPASNPVNEGDYTPNYVTNRPNTNQNWAGSTDINAIIAQIVNALKDKQLAQNVNQASNTGGTASVPTSIAGVQTSGTGTSGISTTGAPSNTKPTPVTAEQKLAYKQWMLAQPNPAGPGTLADLYKAQGVDPLTDPRVDAQAQSEIERSNRRKELYASSGVSAPNNLSPWEDKDWQKYQGSNKEAYTLGMQAKSDPAAYAKLKRDNGWDDATAQSWIMRATDPTAWNAQAAANDLKNGIVAGPGGTPKAPTAGVVDPNKPWETASSDPVTQSAQAALAKLNATTGTPAERQAALQNFLKTTTFTPEQLSAASNGQWGIVDLINQMAGNPVVEKEIEHYKPMEDQGGTNAPTGGLAALATQASTPMTGVDTDPVKSYYGGIPNDGIPSTGSTLNPNSIYQNPGTPNAPTDDLYSTPFVHSGKTPEEEAAEAQAAAYAQFYQNDPYSGGGGGGEKRGGAIHKATGGLTHYTFGKPADVMENLGLRQQQMARGGLPHVSNVPVVQGRMDFRQGSAVHGEGDGQSDDIPAMLADGEYVIDAETVAQIGNGSTKAGAQALDKFRENIRAHKRNTPINKIPPKTKALTSYLKVK